MPRVLKIEEPSSANSPDCLYDIDARLRLLGRWLELAIKSIEKIPPNGEIFSMAPAAGLEPATHSLTANCSTTELSRNTIVV